VSQVTNDRRENRRHGTDSQVDPDGGRFFSMPSQFAVIGSLTRHGEILAPGVRYSLLLELSRIIT
jgi:hypothetical protein